MGGYRWFEKRRRAALWVALLVVTAMMLLLGVWLRGPSPPTKILMATGATDGSFQPVGEQYRTYLEKKGLEVELVTTNGSVENLRRLVDGEVDVALVHGGAHLAVADPGEVLRSIAVIHLQPLWVFYRGPQSARTLSDFVGRKIGVGPEGSGTEAVAKQLLEAHGITAENSQIVNVSFEQSQRALEEGSLDVALLLSSYDRPTIQHLLKRRDVSLMDFASQDAAHSRIFPYLRPLKVYEGLFDLKNNVPDREKTVLATAVMVVGRRDLHPRAVEQLLKAARAIHSPGDLLNDPNRFPSRDGSSLPVHETTETYLESGESLLSRVLPYWVVRWLWRLSILILPLLAVWLPFLKIIPMVYNYRVNRILKRHYVALRELEGNLARSETAVDLRRWLQRLEDLRVDMEGLSRKVPSRLQGEVYQWRLHVSLVRTEALDRLRRISAKEERDDSEPSALPPDADNRATRLEQS